MTHLSRSGRPPRAARPGFSLAEAMVAVSVATVAGSALLTAVGTTVRTSTDVARRTMAQGLAEQLADEVSAAPFPGASNPAPSGPGRSGFDDIDDYGGWSEGPPQARDGSLLGSTCMSPGGSTPMRPPVLQPSSGHLDRSTRSVVVERIEPSGTSDWVVTTQDSPYRRVTVRVTMLDEFDRPEVLAEIVRIHSHVPSAP